MKDFFLRVLAGLILVPFSSGCSCLQSTFCETFQRADVVLKGTVFAKTRFLDETPSSLGEDELRTISLNNASILYGVFVTHVFNGKEVKRFIIVTANESSAACGVDLPFDEENLEEYVFFISGDVWSDYHINSCSSPQLWSSLSEEDLAALHEGCSSAPDECTDTKCKPLQECLVYEEEGGTSREEYCADLCDPSRCDEEQGEVCELQEVQCVRAPCPPLAVCVAPPPPPTGCTTVRCGPFQECLVDRDGNGYCADTCADGTCEEGETCELLPTPCAPGVYPCPPVATCSPTPTGCATLRCGPFQECLEDREGDPYCADTCEPGRCEEGETCELQEVQCFQEPCPPVAVCVEPPPPPTGCTTVLCGPFQECLVDRDGNGYCADTCADGTCEEGEMCELLPTPCAPEVYPCPPVATCSPTPTGCATIRCGPFQECLEDREGDPYCADTCADGTCEEGETCELLPTPCAPEVYPCPPVATCSPTPTGCATLRCGTFQECLEDREGDPYCADTCEPGRCEEGETCELQEVQCFQEPCPPVAVCVETPPPPTGCATTRCPPFTECLLDGSGNPYCADTCEPGKCEEGQTCELLDTPCAPGQDPCPPVAVCTDGGEVECPIFCTLDYVPLCAVNPEGAFRTFGNACGLSAENKCGDVEWTLAYDGECGEPEEDPCSTKTSKKERKRCRRRRKKANKGVN